MHSPANDFQDGMVKSVVVNECGLFVNYANVVSGYSLITRAVEVRCLRRKARKGVRTLMMTVKRSVLMVRPQWSGGSQMLRPGEV